MYTYFQHIQSVDAKICPFPQPSQRNSADQTLHLCLATGKPEQALQWTLKTVRWWDDLRYIYMASPAQLKSRGCIQAIPETVLRSPWQAYEIFKEFCKPCITHRIATLEGRRNYKYIESHYCVFHIKAKQDKEKK